jgi:hypothetical protein
MDREQIEKELIFIKKAMEASTKYTNVAPLGYIAAGVLGLIGPVITYLLLGEEKIAAPALFTMFDITALAVLWLVVLFASVGLSAYFMKERAGKYDEPAWNPTATRMFASQIPQMIVAAAMTFGLFKYDCYQLIPALWLMSYGLLLFAFQFFTGRDHLIQSYIFIVLGVIAAFSPGNVSLLLLAVGFGAVNLFYGFKNHIREIN